MKRNTTIKTVVALVALVVICSGSFIAVRNLNKSQSVTAPITSVLSTVFSTQNTTAEAKETVAVSVDNIATSASTTKEQTTSKAPESTTQAQASTTNPFTTFSSAEGELTAPSLSQYTSASSTETTYNVSSKVQELNASPTTPEDAQELIEEAAKYSKGFLGYLFDPKGNFFYTSSDPWQRQFGFNQLYDFGAAFVVFYYDTMRCKFSYGDKDWMIQFWKGQYGFVFIGAEIGVYTKPKDRSVEHYDCASDEESLFMSLEFYRKGKKLLERDYMRYWWCTGFVPGMLDNFADRSELSMKARITMKDYKMLLSFCNALKGNGREYGVNYTTDGLDVYIEW